ncbi:MAG: phosphotransferase [Actinomycetota bacterium]
MGDIGVPVEVDDLSPAWLSAALGDGAVVSDVDATRIGEGVGFIGQIHRLALTYEHRPEAAPDTVIAKMPTSDPGGRMIGTMLRLYEKESGFYRHLVGDCPLRVPRCFHNAADPDAGNWCLLLEDLDDLTPGDQLETRSHGQALVEIEMLGRLHATWSDGRAEAHGWLPDIADPSSAGLMAMFDDAYPVTMERYAHVIPEHMRDWGPRWAPGALDWVDRFAAEPSTIIHGDYRTDNFMFDGDGDITVLDWQLAMRCPGAYDLLYYLAMSADPDVVETHFDSLIEHYRASLAAAGGTPTDTETLVDQMRGVLIWLTCLGIVNLSQIDPANDRGEALFLTMWRRGVRLADRIDLGRIVP